MSNTQAIYHPTFSGRTQSASITIPEFTFRVKDPISALTHFIGLLLSIIGMPILLIYLSSRNLNAFQMSSYGIFALSMIALYGASTSYHTFNLATEHANKILKKIDHMMIFVLIAGTYTPVCVNILPAENGIPMLIAVWTFAAAGILFKALWVTCPKWVSSVIYICMGWLCIFAAPAILHNLSTTAFLWLLCGGIFYTVGGVIYALKLEVLRSIHPGFGAHELFHIFVMIGSFCHYVVMFLK